MNRFAKFVLPMLLASGTIIALATFAITNENSAAHVAHAQVAQTPTPPRSDIGVTGTGQVFVKPDTGIASVGVNVTAPTLDAALNEVNQKMTAVINAIKAQGVDAADIQTTSYNVSPITNQPKEGESAVVTGYNVQNIVTVKIRNIDNVGKVLDAALAAGANSINSVYFTVDNPTQAENDARTQAVKNAMAKAQTLAAAAGVKVGNIVSISDISPQVIPFVRTAEFAVPAAANSAGPIETGQTSVMVNVEMHFEISQ
ncbi:MAG TPA: SIMPL domain-containing protein [Anaerolineae bacterium]|nr:SIMPL domain-containing protein [Anaerolineae bacterium]